MLSIKSIQHPSRWKSQVSCPIKSYKAWNKKEKEAYHEGKILIQSEPKLTQMLGLTGKYIQIVISAFHMFKK